MKNKRGSLNNEPLFYSSFIVIAAEYDIGVSYLVLSPIDPILTMLLTTIDFYFNK